MNRGIAIIALIFYMTKRWALRPLFDLYGEDLYWDMYDVSNMIIFLLITLSVKSSVRFDKIIIAIISSVLISDIIDLGLFRINEFRVQDVIIFIVTLTITTQWDRIMKFSQRLKRG